MNEIKYSIRREEQCTMTLNTTYNMTLSQCIDLHQTESTDSVYVTSFSYDDTDNSCISLWPVFLPPTDNCTNTSDVTLYTNLDRQDTVANRSWAIIHPGRYSQTLVKMVREASAMLRSFKAAARR